MYLKAEHDTDLVAAKMANLQGDNIANFRYLEYRSSLIKVYTFCHSSYMEKFYMCKVRIKIIFQTFSLEKMHLFRFKALRHLKMRDETCQNINELNTYD